MKNDDDSKLSIVRAGNSEDLANNPDSVNLYNIYSPQTPTNWSFSENGEWKKYCNLNTVLPKEGTYIIQIICGTDNAKTYCRHWPGRTYDKEGGPTVCTFKLDGVKEAYEFSLVAVPAQRRAGVSKSYTGEVVFEPELSDEDAAKAQERARALGLKARLLGAKI